MYGLAIVAAVAAIHVCASWLAAVYRGARARGVRRAVPMAGGRRASVSVVVPAWNERTTLPRCLRSLASVEYPEWEVIVVAGGPDGTYEAALAASAGLPRCRVLRQAPRGKNAALNQALAVAAGDVLVVLDADSEVTAGWLAALVGPVGPDAAATTGWFEPFHLSPVSRAEQMEQIDARLIRGSTTLNGAGSIALRRSAVEAIGGFPEDVRVGVDWDLDARLARAALPRVVCRDAVVRTERPGTFREYWFNELRWRRAHLASILRLSDHFLPDLLTALRNLYVYALAWLAVTFTIGLIVVVAGAAPVAGALAALWLIFCGWLVLRRAALAASVATVTRDASWLRSAWVPPVLLMLALSAMVAASLTLRTATADFQGPRPPRSANHAD